MNRGQGKSDFPRKTGSRRGSGLGAKLGQSGAEPLCKARMVRAPIRHSWGSEEQCVHKLGAARSQLLI